jgi:hypothetical protein
MTIDLAKDRPAHRKSRLTRYGVDKKCDVCGEVIPAGQTVRRHPFGRGKRLAHTQPVDMEHQMVGFCCCPSCYEP